jgi:hypothetical protein
MFRLGRTTENADFTDNAGIGVPRSFAAMPAEPSPPKAEAQILLNEVSFDPGAIEHAEKRRVEVVPVARPSKREVEVVPVALEVPEKIAVEVVPVALEAREKIAVEVVPVVLEAPAKVAVEVVPVAVESSRKTAPPKKLPLGPALLLWERDVVRSTKDSRTIVRVVRPGSGENFVSQMLGAHELYGMMLSAPSSDKGALAVVRENESLIFSTIYGTAAVKFTGTVRKVQFKPTPLIYVEPNRVDMREVRASPRVGACLHATIALDQRELPAIINDIGVGGLSIAAQKSDHQFATGEQFTVNVSLSLLDMTYPLALRATVMTVRSELTRDHPEIAVAGVRVERTSDQDRLALYAFVQERLAQGLGSVWRVLSTR